MNNSSGTSQLSGMLAGVLVNVLVAMLFAMAWNLGPAKVGLPFLTIPQGISLFFCAFILIFWPLYIAVIVAFNMYKVLSLQTSPTQKIEKDVDDTKEQDI